MPYSLSAKRPACIHIRWNLFPENSSAQLGAAAVRRDGRRHHGQRGVGHAAVVALLRSDHQWRLQPSDPRRRRPEIVDGPNGSQR